MAEKAFGKHKHITKTDRSVRHHRPEISDGFEFLRAEGSIVKLDTDPGQGKVYERGRPPRYYAITENGLKKLIADKRISKTQFWQVLSRYCSNIDSVLTLDKIEELLLIFVNHYVKYRYHGFTIYSDDFLKVCNRLFKEKIQISGRVSTFQKVLEVLAINPKIAFNDLVEKVGESKSKVNKVLSMYSYRPRSLQYTDIIKNGYNEENSDFIVKNIITVNQENGDRLTYELSLFGVMLILLIILYNDMKKLKHGLYIKKYSFKDYCDKIGHNYNHKLPLVFRKWDHLTRILQASAIYNFDVVLLENNLVNNESNSRSVIMRGNEEIFQGIRKILQYNNSLMQDLINTGYEVLRDYFLVRFDPDALEKLKDEEDFKKINLVCALLEEIMILSNPLWHRYPRLSLITFTALDPNRILKYMEESFANEISAFYYMNLLKPNIDVSLKQCLSLLVQEIKGDPPLREWLNKWIEDIDSVYQDIHKTVKIWLSSTNF